MRKRVFNKKRDMFIKSVQFKMPVDADHAAGVTERTEGRSKERG